MDYETIIRLLGYGIEFCQLMAAPVAIGALTWRLSK
jgi:hypothetical protein